MSITTQTDRQIYRRKT